MEVQRGPETVAKRLEMTGEARVKSSCNNLFLKVFNDRVSYLIAICT